MARDLIPPPSPAGPPDARSGAARRTRRRAAAGAADAERAGGARRPAPSPFRGRFGFLLGALRGCVARRGARRRRGARDDPPTRPDEGLAAELVAVAAAAPTARGRGADRRAHRAPSTSTRRAASSSSIGQGRPDRVDGLPLSVAVRPAGGDIQIARRHRHPVHAQRPRRTAADQGRQAVRGSATRLLRREALELALYSFRYLPDVHDGGRAAAAGAAGGQKAAAKATSAKAASAASSGATATDQPS